MSQEIKIISLADLVLWTENPRDPIDKNSNDQIIVDRAISDNGEKWNLPRLAKAMGNHYDYSELPTVVYHGDKPVVYDGNRRVALGKIKHKLVTNQNLDLQHLDFPLHIPCNACSQEIALENIFRKHADSGSWLPLERDIFASTYMNKEKSNFLLFEENTGLISENQHLNQRFVKDEIFRDDILLSLGFAFENGNLLSKHDSADALDIFNDLSKKIKDKTISTRNNRGKVLEALDPSNQSLIDASKSQTLRPLNLNQASNIAPADNTRISITKRKSRRTKPKPSSIFGGSLYLRIGNVSNLYRDIVDLYNFYIDRKTTLSQSFSSLVRMSLRLLCETAAKDSKQLMEKYLNENFNAAKNLLTQDEKTTLANQNVSDTTIIQLLHTGAHNYSSTSNIDQTLAISLILGKILTISHGNSEGQ